MIRIIRKRYRLRHHHRRCRRSVLPALCVTLVLLAAALSAFPKRLSEKKPLLLVPDGAFETISVYLHEENVMREMSLDAYLIHVVAAEMPASFHTEALRAQAVASRSYVCFRMRAAGGSGCASHPEADICTDHTCCQAYLSGSEEVDTRILRAVFDTSGEVLTYDSTVINALYHACSGGYTANSEDVFSAALPYLRSVQSPNEENYPQYAAQFEFSASYLSSVFGIDESIPLEEQFEFSFDAHGRVQSVSADGRTYRGTQLRQLLSLPSACMTLSFSPSVMHIATVGCGHGVGMSQVGADAMAQRGADYREILEWYYTGCRIDVLRISESLQQ